jgi:hypothetical protein
VQSYTDRDCTADRGSLGTLQWSRCGTTVHNSSPQMTPTIARQQPQTAPNSPPRQPNGFQNEEGRRLLDARCGRAGGQAVGWWRVGRECVISHIDFTDALGRLHRLVVQAAFRAAMQMNHVDNVGCSALVASTSFPVSTVAQPQVALGWLPWMLVMYTFVWTAFICCLCSRCSTARRAWFGDVRQKEQRSVMTQSMTTYTRGDADPRFRWLQRESEHGCWSD